MLRFFADRLAVPGQAGLAEAACRDAGTKETHGPAFSPITLGTVTLDNRIVIAPMCEYSVQEGCATDWHMIHLGHLALSGAGLLIVEATAWVSN